MNKGEKLPTQTKKADRRKRGKFKIKRTVKKLEKDNKETNKNKSSKIVKI